MPHCNAIFWFLNLGVQVYDYGFAMANAIVGKAAKELGRKLHPNWYD
jgi:hypothetical protein